MMQFIISMIQFALKNENMYNVIQYFPIDSWQLIFLRDELIYLQSEL